MTDKMTEKDLELEKFIKDIHDELLTISYAKELLLTYIRKEEVKLLESVKKDFYSEMTADQFVSKIQQAISRIEKGE